MERRRHLGPPPCRSRHCRLPPPGPASALASRLPFPRRGRVSLPRLRLSPRLRGGRASRSTRRFPREPAGKPPRRRRRRFRPRDGSAGVRGGHRSAAPASVASSTHRHRGRDRRKLVLRGLADPAVNFALAVASSYLAGSVPFGLFVAKLATGTDVRAIGSGNIGATNVARAAGRTAAASTLLLDALKGFLPPFFPSKSAHSSFLGAACGVAAGVCHCFPGWLRFHGGEGGAAGPRGPPPPPPPPPPSG